MYEETTPEQEESILNLEIEMSDNAVYYLRQTCDWARMLVYFSGGAILLGLLVIAVKWWSVEQQFYRAYGSYEDIALVVAAIFALMYITLTGLLFYSTRNVKLGLQAQDVVKVQKGVWSLKIYFMLSAIFGSIYFLMGVVNTIKLFF